MYGFGPLREIDDVVEIQIIHQFYDTREKDLGHFRADSLAVLED